MKRHTLEIGFAALALALGVSAARQAAGDQLLDAPVPVPPAAAQSSARASSAVLERARDNLVRRNPFRINRAPGARAGQPTALASMSAPVTRIPMPRPSLTVRAIVGGPPWSALVDGLPNARGATVVREGDRFDWITIGAITRDTLTAAAGDTAWKFGVPRG